MSGDKKKIIDLYTDPKPSKKEIDVEMLQRLPVELRTVVIENAPFYILAAMYVKTPGFLKLRIRNEVERRRIQYGKTIEETFLYFWLRKYPLVNIYLAELPLQMLTFVFYFIGERRGRMLWNLLKNLRGEEDANDALMTMSQDPFSPFSGPADLPSVSNIRLFTSTFLLENIQVLSRNPERQTAPEIQTYSREHLVLVSPYRNEALKSTEGSRGINQRAITDIPALAELAHDDMYHMANFIHMQKRNLPENRPIIFHENMPSMEELEDLEMIGKDGNPRPMPAGMKPIHFTTESNWGVLMIRKKLTVREAWELMELIRTPGTKISDVAEYIRRRGFD